MPDDENAILISEEYEVLHSIYDEDQSIHFNSQTNITVVLDESKNHKIELWLPQGYPSSEKLKFDLKLYDFSDTSWVGLDLFLKI